MRIRRFALPFILATALGLIIAGPASANHKWGKYHWARTSTETDINLVVDDSQVHNSWAPNTVLTNWNTYGGPITLSSRGGPTVDIEAESDSYGLNGWLGMATIAISDRQGHIDYGWVELNQSYWDGGFGLTETDKQSVYCEEIGHTLGLTHNHNRRFGAESTCMNDRMFNLTPNWHDEDQLNLIYDHADGFSTFSGTQSSMRGRRIVTVVVPAPGRP